MTKTTNTIYMALIGFAIVALALLSLPGFASAASYAYVDATGEVRMVTADTWMKAIAVAPNIHVHSGVLLLNDASDFTIIGDTVTSAK